MLSGPTSATSSGHAGLDDGGVRAAVARGDEGASSSSFVAVIVCVEEVKRALLFTVFTQILLLDPPLQSQFLSRVVM